MGTVGKRLLVWLALAAALALFALPGQALQSFPARAGSVVDDAAVLDAQTVRDIDALNALQADTGLACHVVTRHFLGGAEAQSYCDGLFDAWALGEEDALLLLVIGEEKYAFSAGGAISQSLSGDRLNALLSGKLRTPYLTARDYDGAVGAFLLGLAEASAQARGKTARTDGLFGTSPAQSGADTNQFFATEDWWRGFFSGEGESYGVAGGAVYDPGDYQAAQPDTGFSGRKLVIIIIALIFIADRRKRQGKKGIGLFGWILGIIGVRTFTRGRR